MTIFSLPAVVSWVGRRGLELSGPETAARTHAAEPEQPHASHSRSHQSADGHRHCSRKAGLVCLLVPGRTRSKYTLASSRDRAVASCITGTRKVHAADCTSRTVNTTVPDGTHETVTISPFGAADRARCRGQRRGVARATPTSQGPVRNRPPHGQALGRSRVPCRRVARSRTHGPCAQLLLAGPGTHARTQAVNAQELTAPRVLALRLFLVSTHASLRFASPLHAMRARRESPPRCI